jgi:hypothetical protein
VIVCAIVVQAVCVNAQYVNMKKQRLTKTIPPKRGPTPQGLKINYKKIQIVKITRILKYLGGLITQKPTI